MKQDHYSILGVTPTARQPEIRAAYRALMRLYHPDADASPAAAERARDINVAYSVLSDPEKRACYDDGISARRPVQFEPDPREQFSRSRRSLIGPIAATGFAVIAAGMIAFAISPSIELPSTNETVLNQDPADEQIAAATPASNQASLCEDQAVGGLVKKELFARAAKQRPDIADQLTLVERHALARFVPHDATEDGCKGWLSLDIPPSVAVEGGRTNLNADIEFGLERAHEELQLADLSGANRVVRSLATLGPPPKADDIDTDEVAEAGVQVHRARPVVVASTSSSTGKPLQVRTAKALSPRAASACDSIALRADRIVCESGNLKSLDRQLANFYRQSWDRADERKRTALLGSRQRFDSRRNACDSSSCMTSVYVARLREIGDIMAGKTAP